MLVPRERRVDRFTLAQDDRQDDRADFLTRSGTYCATDRLDDLGMPAASTGRLTVVGNDAVRGAVDDPCRGVMKARRALPPSPPCWPPSSASCCWPRARLSR